MSAVHTLLNIVCLDSIWKICGVTEFYPPAAHDWTNIIPIRLFDTSEILAVQAAIIIGKYNKFPRRRGYGCISSPG